MGHNREPVSGLPAIRLYDDAQEKSVAIFEEADALLSPGHLDTSPSLRDDSPFLPFQQRGDLGGLNKSVWRFNEVAALLPTGHLDPSSSLRNLGKSLLRRFKQHGNLGDLTMSVSIFEEAVTLLPKGHRDKPSSLRDLGTALFLRFDWLGGPGDLTMSVSMFEEALALLPKGHPDRPSNLRNLGNALLCRFQRSGNLGALTMSVSMLEQANALLPEEHPDRPSNLRSLGNALLSWGPVDLTMSVSMFEKAVALLPERDPNRLSSLGDLGNSLLHRFEEFGDVGDLTMSVLMCEQAVALLPEEHPDRLSNLRNLGNALLCRFEQLGGLRDLSMSVSMFEEALALLPEGHPDRSSNLRNLGNALLCRFQRSEDIDASNRSVTVLREARDLSPLPRFDRALILKDLANSLLSRYQHLGDLSDIHEVLSVLREAIGHLPTHHPARPSTLKLLGDSLLRRFEHLDDLSDVQEALLILREAVYLSPNIDPNNDLGYCLVCRFEKLGDLRDIQDAVVILESEPSAKSSNDSFGVLAKLVSHSCFREALGTVIPGLVSILRCDDDPDVRYKTAVSLDKFLEYPSLRRLLLHDIPLIDAQIGCNIQDTQRPGESQDRRGPDSLTDDATTTSVSRPTQDSDSAIRGEPPDHRDGPDPPTGNATSTSVSRSTQDSDSVICGEPQPHREGLNPPTGNATTTSISRSTQDSVIRRRGLQLKHEDSYHAPPSVLVPSPFTIPEGLSHYLKAVSSHLGGASPQSNPTRDRTDWGAWLTVPDIGRWLANIGNYIGAAYVFMIAPPFVHDRVALWDLQRLEHRLGAFQTWVWAANAALFATSGALLAVTGVSSSPFAQSFVILCGIFGLFGFVYTVFLAFRIGDCKAQCSGRFIDRANSTRGSHSLWNVAIMLSLPLTWMAWAILSLVCCMVSIGVQQAILDLRSSRSGDTETGLDYPAPKALSIFQLSGFMVVIVWSAIYMHEQLEFTVKRAVVILHRNQPDKLNTERTLDIPPSPVYLQTFKADQKP
ncbi:hypothetical protein B0H13DRAFT_2289234 [Mycena leptocephala]|nr:hypothetical protein B0H13DRAFT_2289234 [Mycena leptocephala]